MNKDQLLQMTVKDLEMFLNENISSINCESIDDSFVKGKMIHTVKPLFDDTIGISIPYYTNREFIIGLGRLIITFKVCAKNTGKTKQISRLRKKDIKTIGSFKFDNIEINFYNPYFEIFDYDKFIVESSKHTCTGGAQIILKNRTVKIIDMLSKNILLDEIQKQNENWKNITSTVILHAAQPILKQQYFGKDFNQEKWDLILNKVEENNKELIINEIEKIFNII